MGICESGFSLRPIQPLSQRKLTLRNIIYSLKKSPKLIYNNKSIIGKGTYSCVYLVQHKQTHKTRALKEIRKSSIKLNSRNSLNDEIMIFSSLDHPNIVKVFEVIDTSNFLYITSEYLEGGILLQLLSEHQRLSESTSRKYMYDVLGAIKYCHQKGIVHSDLRPENLLFDSEGPNATIKINDFSTSRLMGITQTKDMPVLGTIYYMSPEQLSGKVSEKSDIWSLGIILYMMLSGKPPFIGDSFEVTANKIKECPVYFEDPNIANVSNEALDVLEKMLEKDPKDRPTAAELLNFPWFKKIQIEKPSFSVCQKLLNNLMFFKFVPICVKYLLRVVSYHGIELEEKVDVDKYFKVIDKNCSGLIGEDDLRDEFREMGIEEDVEELIFSLSFEGNQCLDYSDFVVATIDWKNCLQLESFNYFVEPGSAGCLSFNDLRKMIPTVQYADILQFFASMDTDKKGSVTMSQLYEKVLESFNSKIVQL